MAGLDAHPGVWAFDDVGGGQAAAQRGRYIQTVDGEALVQTFDQTAGRGRVFLIQPCGQFLDARHAFLGREFPGRAEHAFDLRPVFFGQVAEHVAQLVGAAALHRLVGAEDGVDGDPQRLGAVDDEQHLALWIDASGHDVFQQRGDDGGILRGTFAHARHVRADPDPPGKPEETRGAGRR